MPPELMPVELFWKPPAEVVVNVAEPSPLPLWLCRRSLTMVPRAYEPWEKEPPDDDANEPVPLSAWLLPKVPLTVWVVDWVRLYVPVALSISSVPVCVALSGEPSVQLAQSRGLGEDRPAQKNRRVKHQMDRANLPRVTDFWKIHLHLSNHLVQELIVHFRQGRRRVRQRRFQ